MELNYYHKTLTSTDIDPKLIVPMELLGNLFPDPNPDSERIPLSFKDEWGKDYTFYLKVRSTGQYKKPEFMFKGWHAFVVEKNLRVGESIFLWWDTVAVCSLSASSLHAPWHHLPPLKYFSLRFCSPSQATHVTNMRER